ncbi:MAG: DUF4124 domain-containing protein [Betaproteobacteria bacterium]
MKTNIALCCALAFGVQAQAARQICKYVDGEGRVTFADSPQKNARKVMCFDPIPVPPPRQSSKPPAAKPNVDEANFPRVDEATQRRRDSERRRILEQELAEEQKLLEHARQAIGIDQGGPPGSDERIPESLKPMREAIVIHEKNVEAIRRELSNVK